MNSSTIKFSLNEVLDKTEFNPSSGTKMAIVTESETQLFGIVQMPTGKSSVAHYHKETTEVLSIISGEGIFILQNVNDPSDKIEVRVKKNDMVKAQPYMIHQVKNNAKEDLVYCFFCHKDAFAKDRISTSCS